MHAKPGPRSPSTVACPHLPLQPCLLAQRRRSAMCRPLSAAQFESLSVVIVRARGGQRLATECRISWRMSSSIDNLSQFQPLHPNKNIFSLQRYPPFAYSLPAYPSGLLPQYGQPNHSVATDQQQQPPLYQQQGPQLTSIHSVEAELLSSNELARASAYSCGHCGKIKVTTSGVANGAKAFTRS